MNKETFPVDTSEAIAILQKLIPNIESELDAGTALATLIASLPKAPKPSPVTRHTDLSTPALQLAMVKEARDLDNANADLKGVQAQIEAIYEADYSMPALKEDLERFETKVKELKGEIAARHNQIIPLTLQERLKDCEAEVAERRDVVGDLLSDYMVRFPTLEPSNLALGFVKVGEDYFEVMVNRTADGGWTVNRPDLFFATLPESHKELFKVSITPNTKKITRKEINQWFEVEAVIGTLTGVVKSPRVLHDLETHGLLTLRRLSEDDPKPVSFVEVSAW